MSDNYYTLSRKIIPLDISSYIVPSDIGERYTTLEQENKRLREALERISNQTDEMLTWKDAGVRCQGIAREALKDG